MSNVTAIHSAPAFDISKPLTLGSDQRETWLNFGEDGKTFDEAANLILEARKVDGEIEDISIASLSSYAFGPTTDGTAALAAIPAPGRESRLIPLRAHAFGQLCGRVGAPPAYVKHLPAKLQMACINHGIQSEGGDSANLVRLVGGEARAILSDRYAPLDNEMVLDIMRDTLGAAGYIEDVRVRSVAVGRTMSLRLTFPGHDSVVKGSPALNDIVEVGLDLLNGEIGNRSVSMTPLAWRLVCLNGMRSAQKLGGQRMRHVGESDRLEATFRDALPAALGQANGMRENMEKAIDVLVDDILGEFAGLRAFGMSASETQNVARDVVAEVSSRQGQVIALPSDTKTWAETLAESALEVTAFDVLNGVTHVAQTQGTDRRIQMEESADRYLRRRVA